MATLNANDADGKFSLDSQGVYQIGEPTAIDYPDSGNDVCFKIEANSFWFQHRNQVILSMLNRFRFEHNFADIGGGNGFQSSCIRSAYPEKECYLIEPGYQGCLNAKSYGLKHIYNCTSNEFDFESNNIGGVGLFDVLEHIEDDIAFLTSLGTQLGRGTKVYITVPAYQTLWTSVDSYAGHHRRYTTARLDQAFKRAGFEKLYSTYFFSYAPIPLFILRKLPEYFRSKPTSDAELLARESENLTRVPSQSRILKIWHDLELRLIAKSRVYFGGSVAGVYTLS
jgi:hypothetical protein